VNIAYNLAKILRNRLRHSDEIRFNCDIVAKLREMSIFGFKMAFCFYLISAILLINGIHQLEELAKVISDSGAICIVYNGAA
jgi:hypothetical protein